MVPTLPLAKGERALVARARGVCCGHRIVVRLLVHVVRVRVRVGVGVGIKVGVRV